MQRDIKNQAEPYIERSNRRRIWQKIVSVLACVVVFCTTYALILPAITQEHAYCGLAEHTHGTECYAQAVSYEINCSAESIGVDKVIHTHDSSCYVDGTLLCKLPELSAHKHGDSCYQITPATDGHTHADACYDENQAIICGLEETPATEETKTLICKKAEVIVHTHTSSCGDSCSLPVTIEHVHTEQCKTAITVPTDELTCTQREHKHSDSCYSNLSADLEGVEDWTATLPKQLTGEYREDIIAVAKTQLGYTESVENYEVTEDGTHKGYTRYGEWYGDKYGDWCAMFVSFCLEYAGVDKTVMPQDANCQNWIETLQKEEYNLYHAASTEYAPQVGDIIFFEWNDGDANADHVGIVVEIIPATDDTPAMINTIEGNSADKVQYQEYELGAATIIGYAELPVQEFSCGKVGHVHGNECTDVTGTLVCELEEHIHEVVCSATPLTEEEQKAVDEVIALIEALPTYEEVDAKLLEYEEAEDMEGYEAYYTEVGQQARAAYEAYAVLSDNQKLYVTNVQKLNDLEWIWSAVTLIDGVVEIDSDAPTTTWYTSTRDFVELNLYDYNGNVNTNYWSKNNWYPGFQWNGGAYSNDSGDSDSNDYRYYSSSKGIGIPNAITDRNYIDSIDFGNSLITNLRYGNGINGSYTKSVNATGVGKTSSYYSTTGPINWLYGSTNKPIGTSTTDASYPAVMKDTLVNGYPALSDGTMLDYLFKEGDAVDKLNTNSIDGLFQKNEVTGEYSYNSRTNHAQYTNDFFQLYDDIITPNFITYPFGNFLPLNSINDLKKSTQVGAINYSGGMADYVEQLIGDLRNDKEGLGEYWSDTQEQLAVMLEEYKENWSIYPRTINGVSNNWNNLSAANAIRDYFWGDTDGNGDQPSADTSFITQGFLDKMYNIDWDVQTNFFFGMEMKMNFMMPKDGMTGNDTNGDGASDYPMLFKFTGDDDVWVYIDDVLFLDLSGIHRHVGGEIDFVNGKVYYYALDTENGGDVSSTPYKTYTFEEILTAAGKDSSVLENGTFKDYTTHSFNFYYMERGSGSSVCRINFNFPLIQKNAITITKENVPKTDKDNDGTLDTDTSAEVLGNPDYYFNIVNSDNELFVGPKSKTGVSTYKIMQSNGQYVVDDEGNPIIYSTDAYGIFSLKAGQSAVFEGINENSGKFFVQELIKAEDNTQYYEKVMINGVESRYNDLVDWSYREYFSDSDNDKYTGPYGYKWYAHSGYDTDSSADRTFYFEAENGVITSKLEDLRITKVLKDVVDNQEEKIYRIYISLDGELLPEGTQYTVGTTAKDIGFETDSDGNPTHSYVEIAAGETAIISNILSGTEFEVWEADASKSGYAVTYSVSGVPEGETINDGTSITGVIHYGAEVSVAVTNAGKGIQLPITGTKEIPNSDGKAYSFEFNLQEVKNATGAALEPEGEIIQTSVEIAENSNLAEFAYTLTYYDEDVGTHYYKVTEKIPSEDINFVYDTTIYIVEVLVTKDTSTGVLTAAINNIYKDATVVDNIRFVNKLLDGLTIEKEVSGRENDDTQFTFEIKLSESDETTITNDLTSTKTNTNTNSSVVETVQYNDELKAYVVYLKADEKIEIQGIPYGATWKITEGFTDSSNTISYIPTWKISGTDESEDNAEANGTIETDGNYVIYTNIATYTLPESGGIGTNLYIMGGALLIAIAGFLLYKNSKRGKEDYDAS